MKNSLLKAYSKPAEFALRILKEKGYMANLAGEVIHIIKCIPTPVTLARPSTCYSHLPVIVGNETMFVTPYTHILLKRSPQIDCNAFVAPMYNIDGNWVRLTPQPTRAIPPEELEPLTKPTWKYESIENLAVSGIYSEKDLAKLQDHLMFAEEQTAILDTLARGSIGEIVNTEGMSFAHLIDERSIEKIAERATARLWGWFTGFGTFSAGMIGLFMAFKVIKFVIDTVIHGFALHKAFGWSVWLLGALWDSVSNFLLHFKQRATDGMKEESNNIEKGKEAKEGPQFTEATSPREPNFANNNESTLMYPNLQLVTPTPIYYERK